MTEADIMREIQVAVSGLGHRVLRNNVGALKDANGRWVQFGLCKGSSDLIGWTSAGRFLAIEVKSSTGRATKEQIAFIEAVRASGGVAFVARSADEALSALKDI